jgi:dihydrofolate reductase
MAKLIYAAITSLDGFIEDADGKFDWSEPDAEVHGFVNQLEGSIGTHLLGRRMYETLAVWDTIGLEPAASGDAGGSGDGAASGEDDGLVLTPEVLEFAEVWRATDKIVYSRTLPAVTAPRTRLEREFDPEAVRRLKETADRDLGVSGPDLAQHAFAAGLVDEVFLYVCPVAVGGGKPGLPRGIRVDFELLDERRFANGVVHTRYRTR